MLSWPVQGGSFLPILVYAALAISPVSIPARRFSKYRRGLLSKGQAWVGAAWDVFELLGMIVLASALGRAAGILAGALAEPPWPGMAAEAGLIALILASLAAANAARWAMHKAGKFLRLP
jgi:hypothetical protein